MDSDSDVNCFPLLSAGGWVRQTAKKERNFKSSSSITQIICLNPLISHLKTITVTAKQQLNRFYFMARCSGKFGHRGCTHYKTD